MKTALTGHLQAMGGLLRKSGPYLALELVMPGGTLLAVLLFLYQRHRALRAAGTLAQRDPLVVVVDRVRALLRRVARTRVIV